MAQVQGAGGVGLPANLYIYNPFDWRAQLLKQIGAPVTRNNMAVLQGWALSESGYNSAYGTNMAGPGYYNPLAITDSYGLPYVSNSVTTDGVMAFASQKIGVEATARFLEHGYGDVIQGLRDNNAQATYDAVNQSGWCAGCQGGLYPVDLHAYVANGEDPQEPNYAGRSDVATAVGNTNSSRTPGTGQGGGSNTTGLLFDCGSGTSIGPIQINTNVGCYVESAMKATIMAGASLTLGLVGMWMLFPRQTRQALSALPVGGGAGRAVLSEAQSASGGAVAPAAPPPQEATAPAVPKPPSEVEIHNKAMRRARLRDARAKARRSEHLATQEKMRTGGPLHLDDMTEARIERARKRGATSRPDRIAG